MGLRLTSRETELLGLLVHGTVTTEGLATALVVSENTVRFHLASLRAKLGVHSRTELVLAALAQPQLTLRFMTTETRG